MQSDKTPQEQDNHFEQTAGVNITQPHPHNPFEEKTEPLTEEEKEAIEQFKEAQTERD